MIGVFDSGSGGLTVCKELRTRLPKADVIYFGDIANAPYGNKSEVELGRLTANAIAFLQSKHATHIISACNSVATLVTMGLFEGVTIQPSDIIEMVGPTAAHFKEDLTSRFALCATVATIQSGIYQKAFETFGKKIETVPIPELATLIEFGGSEQDMTEVIRQALQKLTTPYDHLILGCTHYPLVKSIFQKLLPEEVVLIDPATFVAEQAEIQFAAEKEGKGEMHFFITKESQNFRHLVESFSSPQVYTIDVV